MTRVAVLGAGYAGLVLARTLERELPESATLSVVDDTGEHLIQHELHRAIRRPALADTLTVPLDDMLDRATLHRARVSDVDPVSHEVSFADDRESLPYDVGAICLGAQTADHGIPGVETHATPLKRRSHAATIREQFLDVAETGGTVVVGGAGLSGVQVAGELAAFAREEDADIDVLLLEQADAVAPAFPREFQIAVRRELETRGVEVRTGERVTAVTGDAVCVADGDGFASDQVVWTGGIRGRDALAGERPTVQSTLALPADPAGRTFALGDAARVIDDEGTAVPASAQAATREARTAARNVCRIVADDDAGFDPRLERFTFDTSGWLVTVGDGAVATVGPAVFTGAAAKALKSSVGARYLASAGTIRDAVSLVREEFRHANAEGNADASENGTPDAERDTEPDAESGAVEDETATDPPPRE